ncbi:MAG TPA: ABC transporter substrate-binding protein [Pseudolabrys sp.]|jgi:ABC-type nitrate/sulfonate/bicarbonate transport system substrate-binding protein
MGAKSKFAAVFALALPVFASMPYSARAADTVRVGLAAVYPAYAVPYAAKELGLYKEKNLDVEITQFRGGPATQEALASGAIDISTITPGAAALAIAKGVQEKIVALSVPPTPQGWYILVPAASPIKSMAELKGKTVGVTQKGSLTDFWVQRAAAKAGVTVQTIPLGAPAVMPALKAKQVDAAILWPIYSYQGLAAGDFRSIDDLGATFEPSVSEGWAASDGIIQKRAAVLHRWLEANSKAIVYMQNHEDWAISFLKHYFDEKDDHAVKLVVDNFIKRINPDGVMKPEWMQASLELAASAGMATKLTADHIFSTEFTPIKSQ